MGEFELLARVRERLPPPRGRVRVGSGDDAAVTVPGGATATSVDALVEGVHFSRDGTGLGQAGSKALATALSDLAAMGAEPGEAYVVLTVPPELDEDAGLEAVDGMVAMAAATGTTLAGGAAAGLLLSGLDVPGLAAPTAAALRRRQVEPVPRLAAGRALAAAGATAM